MNVLNHLKDNEIFLLKRCVGYKDDEFINEIQEDIPIDSDEIYVRCFYTKEKAYKEMFFDYLERKKILEKRGEEILLQYMKMDCYVIQTSIKEYSSKITRCKIE